MLCEYLQENCSGLTAVKLFSRTFMNKPKITQSMMLVKSTIGKIVD